MAPASQAAACVLPLDGGACLSAMGTCTHNKALPHLLSAPPPMQACELQLFDLKTKSVACSLELTAPPRRIIPTNSRVVVVLADGRILSLTEKDSTLKLDLLFRKNLYPTALALAHSQAFAPSLIADIHRRHAEHLYAKGTHLAYCNG